MKYPFASSIIKEIGPKLGIKVELEPEFGFAGELILPNGKSHIFYNTSLNINLAGSASIAKDKHYTKYFLQKKGFNVAVGKTFFSDKLCRKLSLENRRGIAEMADYAQEIGWPVYVKPNNLSGGFLVHQVEEKRELLATAVEIFNITDVVLVEQSCPGQDYRVVVLDSRIIAVYKRTPLTITGNDFSSVNELIEAHIMYLSDCGRLNTNISSDDRRIDYMLSRQKISRESVLKKNTKIPLLPNANLSCGGEAFDVTASIHKKFSILASRACETCGLRLAGVDIICDDITLSPDAQKWYILEINGSPGMDNFANIGEKQFNIVSELYLTILKSLL